MEILKDKYQRYGALGTILFHLLLLLLFLFFGLKTPVPIPQQNIVINFGTSNEGSGEVQPVEPAATEAVEPVISNPKPVVSPAKLDAVTQNNPNAPSVTDKKTEKVTEPVKEPEKQVNQKALYTKKAGSSSGSEGETNTAGDQGDPLGSKDASSHSGGSTGSGKDSYSLGNRKAVQKIKPKYECQETGTVVVSITVDKQGNVVKATGGARGTTNAAPCLVDRAQEAAMKTKWEPDNDAPELQLGQIIYNFELK